MPLFLSFFYTIFIGLIDAAIKGNVAAFYPDWSHVPWFFKDANLIYPGLIAFLFLSGGLSLARYFSYNLRPFLTMLIIWGLSGLESLAYWFWIMILGINQPRPWLPDPSLFGWYPLEAPWLNIFPHLKLLSGGGDVARNGLLIAVALAIIINLCIQLIGKLKKQKINSKL